VQHAVQVLDRVTPRTPDRVIVVPTVTAFVAAERRANEPASRSARDDLTGHSHAPYTVGATRHTNGTHRRCGLYWRFKKLRNY
jgi:hypothetical protein